MCDYSIRVMAVLEYIKSASTSSLCKGQQQGLNVIGHQRESVNLVHIVNLYGKYLVFADPWVW